jgi:hypothetical protein
MPRRMPSPREPGPGAAQPNRKCERFWTLPQPFPLRRRDEFENFASAQHGKRVESATANSIAFGFQQVSSIFSFGLRKIRMFVEHNARAKPVEVELPQLVQTTIGRAECRNYFRHAGYASI